jgi:hypothetical protein
VMKGYSMLVKGCHTIAKNSLVSYYCSNVHVSTEDKTDDVKERFYKELG